MMIAYGIMFFSSLLLLKKSQQADVSHFFLMDHKFLSRFWKVCKFLEWSETFSLSLAERLCAFAYIYVFMLPVLAIHVSASITKKRRKTSIRRAEKQFCWSSSRIVVFVSQALLLMITVGVMLTCWIHQTFFFFLSGIMSKNKRRSVLNVEAIE